MSTEPMSKSQMRRLEIMNKPVSAGSQMSDLTPQETHSRNLAWIDTRIAANQRFLIKTALTTLRKVLEIHAPDGINECGVCIATWQDEERTYKYANCDKCGSEQWVAENFPCPTYRTITEGLGLSMSDIPIQEPAVSKSQQRRIERM